MSNVNHVSQTLLLTQRGAAGEVLTRVGTDEVAFVPVGTGGGGTIVLSAAGGWPSATSGAAGPTSSETAVNKVNTKTLDFADGAAILFAEWTAILPANYAGGTLTAQFVWSAIGVSTNSIVLGLAARAFGDNVVLDQAFGTSQIIVDAHTAVAGNILITGVTPAITIAGTPVAGQLLQLRMFRNPTSASDTLAETVNVYAVRVSY